MLQLRDKDKKFFHKKKKPLRFFSFLDGFPMKKHFSDTYLDCQTKGIVKKRNPFVGFISSMAN